MRIEDRLAERAQALRDAQRQADRARRDLYRAVQDAVNTHSVEKFAVHRITGLSRATIDRVLEDQ